MIIPAIDLIGAKVVRLKQGSRDKKIYSCDPQEVAEAWAMQGAKLIHLVDLEGAFSGKIKNLNSVKKILKSVRIPVEFGGGVRDLNTVRRLLDLGVFRVVLGTRAAEDRKFLQSAFARFRDKIIISIDSRAGRIKTRGWKISFGDNDPLAFAIYLKELGFKQFIYTDISKDGTLKGPDVNGIKDLLEKVKIRVIASGGVSSLKDLARLRPLVKKGLSGVIIGKALYEGRFTLRQAIKYTS